MTKLLATLYVVGALMIATTARAATENFAVDNSTLASAQDLGLLTGSIHLDGIRGTGSGRPVADDDLADFYSFMIDTPLRVWISVNAPGAGSFSDDPIVGLFDSAGTLLDSDDDGGGGWASSLFRNLDGPGSYFVAVSGYPDFAFDGGGSTNFLYILDIVDIGVAAVPVPGGLVLLGPALFGLGLLRRRASPHQVHVA